MPGASDAHVGRLADLIRDAIVNNTDSLLVAGGKAVVTIFDADGNPRIELTSTQSIQPQAVAAKGLPASRLPEEIRLLADDIRRGIIKLGVQVKGARQIEIEIQMRGARPDFEFVFRYPRS